MRKKTTVETLAEPVVDRPLPGGINVTGKVETSGFVRPVYQPFDVLDNLDLIQASCAEHVACIGSRVDPSYVLARQISQIAASCKAVQDLMAERGPECYPAPKENENGQ